MIDQYYSFARVPSGCAFFVGIPGDCSRHYDLPLAVVWMVSTQVSGRALNYLAANCNTRLARTTSSREHASCGHTQATLASSLLRQPTLLSITSRAYNGKLFVSLRFMLDSCHSKALKKEQSLENFFLYLHSAVLRSRFSRVRP